MSFSVPTRSVACAPHSAANSRLTWSWTASAIWARTAGESLEPSCVAAPLVESMRTHLTAFIAAPPRMKIVEFGHVAGYGRKDRLFSLTGIRQMGDRSAHARQDCLRIGRDM